MGIGTSRRPSRAAQSTAGNGNSYKYPPKTGNYFGPHFIMGGEKFESSKSDAYLFGENEDLNFLGSRPTPFPYPVPQPREPTKTLRSLVNIRRDSVRFVKDIDEMINSTDETSRPRYNIEFTFDTDVRCAITIYYFAKEEINNKQAVYRPRDPKMNSETFHYKRGANQIFSQPNHVIEPNQFSEDDWKYNTEFEVIPVVIQCVVEEPEHEGHSHMTFAIVEKSLDGGFSLKALKQKQMVDGLCYLLQEVYGIENKNLQRSRQQDDDIEDNGSECVICMCEMRDTLILPCRHLCLCNSCADNLRYQANNCPICRAKFHALLQLKAMQRRTNTAEANDESNSSRSGIPRGYEAVSLIEALNGPTQPHCACSVPTLPNDATAQSLSSVPNNSSPEAGLQKENRDSDIHERSSSPKLPSDKPTCDEIENVAEKEMEGEEEEAVAHSSPICASPKENDGHCLDASVPRSDDEESEDPSSSTYATPLHHSRVILRSSGPLLVETGSPEHIPAGESVRPAEPTDDGRLRTSAAGCSDDSRYSSSSSTRDLLEHNAEDAENGPETQGIVGCVVEEIDISVV